MKSAEELLNMTVKDAFYYLVGQVDQQPGQNRQEQLEAFAAQQLRAYLEPMLQNAEGRAAIRDVNETIQLGLDTILETVMSNAGNLPKRENGLFSVWSAALEKAKTEE